MANVKVRVLAPNFIRRGSVPGDEFSIPEAQAERLRVQGRVEIIDTPTDSWTVAQLKEYAQERGVELNGARTKAEILTALAGADRT